MLFAVVSQSSVDSGRDHNFERDKTTIPVYTSENHGTTIEVPLTPESTVADILDCVSDPVRGSGYLVAVTQDTEYILQAADNAFSFVTEQRSKSESPLTFVLRYLDPERPWPPPDLEARRHQMRRPQPTTSSSSSQLQQHQQHCSADTLDYDNYAQLASTPSYAHSQGFTTSQRHNNVLPPSSKSQRKLPGGPGDLTLAELQEMATRQQQQMESQQQVLVAKEQRLKYLKQQEARHAQLASESERLRKIRERVESQELKLKKLRALRGQAEQYRSNNGQLNSELDAVRAVFNEKEKELAMAVARVDQLTRQLNDIRNGKTNTTGLTGQKHAAAALELEKLRKELVLRNKLNEQQTNNIAAKEKVLQQKKEEMKNMDNRILELQQRLKKRKHQEDQNRQNYNKQAANNNKIGNKENANAISNNQPNAIKSGDPYIQYAPSDVVKDDSYSQQGHFAKQDPKYQTLPAGVRFTQHAADVNRSSKPQQQPHHQSQYETRDSPIDYNLPVVLPIGHGNNNNKAAYNQQQNKITTSQQQQQRPPPPTHPPPSHSNNMKKPQQFNNNDASKPNQNYTNFPPQSTQANTQPAHIQQQSQNQQKPTDPRTNRNYKQMPGPNTPRGTTRDPQPPPPPSSLHPVISIHEEERQAGSGQSSPASSEGSSNSSGGIQIKQDESNVNEAPLGPVSAMIQRLNSNKGTTNITEGAKPTTDPSPHYQQQVSGQNGLAAKTAFEGVTTFLSGNNDDRESQKQRKESNSDFSKTSNNNNSVQSSPPPSSTSQQPPHPGSHPQLNLKPAPTYRYASKNQIANTYMGRLGGAAMDRYQQNLNKLYKNMESSESKSSGGVGAGDGSLDPDQQEIMITGAVLSGGQEGDGQQTFGAVSPHDYPDIASDKGSYKLNTPKQVRRRHSDGESEEVNKALQDRQEQEAKTQSKQINDASKGSKPANQTVPDKSSENEKTSKANNATSSSSSSSSSSKDTESVQPVASPSTTISSSTTTVPSSSSSSSLSSSTPAAVAESKSSSSAESKEAASNKKSNKAAEVVAVKKTKSLLKKKGVRRTTNRVRFDPLALLLDGSLEGELDLVKKVAVQVDDVSTPNDEGITALHNAICAGHYDIVKFLIEFGCDVNSPDSDGWTPLHCAASCNNLPMVRFLVEHGACVFATTISDQETAADKCEEDEDGYDGCSDYLYSIQEKLGITNGGEVYAVFDYTASNGDELTFCINDKISVLRKGDETEKEWWWARLVGKEGYIPRNLLGLYPRVLQQPSEVSEC